MWTHNPVKRGKNEGQTEPFQAKDVGSHSLKLSHCYEMLTLVGGWGKVVFWHHTRRGQVRLGQTKLFSTLQFQTVQQGYNWQLTV